MSVLVTGAAGFLGSHLVQRLHEAGQPVVAVDALVEPYGSLKRHRASRLPVPLVTLDLSKRGPTAAFFSQQQFSRVVHLAARSGVRLSASEPSSYVDHNLVAFANVLEGCRQSSVDHLVYASSSSVYGELPAAMREDQAADRPLSLYAATKRSNELLAHSYSSLHGLRTTGVRFFSLYGPAGRPDMALWIFAKAMLAGEPIRVFGHPSRDFTYVGDAVEALIRLLDRKGEPAEHVNVGEGRAIPLMEVVHALERALDLQAEIIQEGAAAGDATRTQASTEHLRSLIDWAPHTPLDQGVRAFVEWFHEYQSE